METTFISIHDLTLDARLLYVSNSIVDILGYSPHEVIGKSCWEYFHPEEIPFAREIHGRGVKLDKAAVLTYCKIRDKHGYWVGCECVFTIVHDVLVACTSIYRRGWKSQRRAAEAPIIRQLFSSSPRDPRYHMLTYISSKFSQPQSGPSHEPRAALFLNRFTRTLTIMYATNGLAEVLGLTAEELKGKSFYYCIQENCLQEAVKCLESAKANDSIAYLRFWFRDPRIDDAVDCDEPMSDEHSSDDDEGGVHLDGQMDVDNQNHQNRDQYLGNRSSGGSDSNSPNNGQFTGSRSSAEPNSRSSSGNSTEFGSRDADVIFDQSASAHSSTSSLPSLMGSGQRRVCTSTRRIELEAVVSCTSDGLVAILRVARPFIPQAVRQPHRIPEPTYANGLFASPWAMQPVLPEALPQDAFHYPPYRMPSSGTLPQHASPQTEQFMQSIREVAVFAWSLIGINGSLAQYSRGTPAGEAQPPGGLPIWDPHTGDRPHPAPYQQAAPNALTAGHEPYWQPHPPQTYDQWHRDNRVRMWTGQQNLLGVKPSLPPPVPGAMDVDGYTSKHYGR